MHVQRTVDRWGTLSVLADRESQPSCAQVCGKRQLLGARQHMVCGIAHVLPLERPALGGVSQHSASLSFAQAHPARSWQRRIAPHAQMWLHAAPKGA